MKILVNDGGMFRGLPTTLPSTRFARVARTNSSRRVAASRPHRKESKMPATYLPIKRAASKGHRKSNVPARSSRTGRFLKGHRSNLPAKTHFSGKHRGQGFRYRAGQKARKGPSAWAKKQKHYPIKYWTRTKPKARKSKAYKAAKKSRPRAKTRVVTKVKVRKVVVPKVSYRTKKVIIHKTKRMRNPVGFDHADSLWRLGTWGKVAVGVAFGLGGLVVAFGIPKGLAVITGRDAFQRGWGGVATSAVASIAVGLGVGLVSKRAGLALLVAAGTGVFLLAINALHPKAAQAVIPVNEATLAAMLPTFEGSGQGPADYQPGNFHRQIPQTAPAQIPGRGPRDFYPATANTRSSTAGDEASFYGSALAPKERF